VTVNLAVRESCGTDIFWLNGVSRQPLEAHPTARLDGERGFLVLTRAGKKYWANSVDHPNAPKPLPRTRLPCVPRGMTSSCWLCW
jgi:hypothetical protein